VRLQNKIITRGLGGLRSVPESSGLVVQGYGPLPPAFVVTTLERPLRLRLGQSGLKRRMREFDEIIVWAKLIEVNDMPPPKKVEGWITVRVKRGQHHAMAMAEHISSRTRKAWETIKVSVWRVK
jgi:hypothetical protein